MVKGRDQDSSRPDKRDLELKRRVFHSISGIIESIHEHMSSSTIHHMVLETALEITEARAGLIGELNTKGNLDCLMVVRSEKAPNGLKFEEVKDITMDKFMARVIHHGDTIIENNLKMGEFKGHPKGIPKGPGQMRNMLATPFTVLGRMMGILAIGDKVDGFDEEDKDLAVELANILSLARSKLMALDSAIKRIGDGIALVDRNGVLSSVNDSMERMFKYKASEIEGRSLLGLFLDIESASPLGEAIAGAVMEGSWSGEAMGLRRDGTRFPVHLSLTAIDEESAPRTGFMAVIRDISAEREAKGMAELYLETAGVMILALDIEGRVTTLNRKGEEVTGWSRDELRGKDWFRTMVPEATRERTRKVFEVLLRSDEKDRWAITRVDGESVDIPIEGQTYSIIDRHGQERILHWQHSLLRNSKGLVVGVLSSGNDITERTIAEERMKASEELYRSLIRASPDSITVSDLDGNITEISRAALELYGTNDPNDLIGKNALELIVPEDHPRAMANLRRTLEDGSMRGLEYTLYRKDGSTYRASMGTSLVKDAQGRPKSFIATVRDITPLKKAEERISEAEERYKSLFDTIPVGIIRTRLSTGEIVMANDVAARTMGYTTTREFIECVTIDTVYPPGLRKRFMERLMRHGELKDVEMVVTVKDGTRRWMSVNAKIDPTGQYIDTTGMDITETKEAQNKLRRAEELYRTIFEQAPVAIMQVDVRTMRPTVANQYAIRKLGYSSMDEFMQANPLDRFTVNESEGDFLERLYRTGSLDSVEVQIERKDGSKGWFLCTLRYDADGETIDATGVDITAMKELDVKLREAEGHYRSIYENSMVGIMRTRLSDGKFIMANEISARTMGFDSVEDFLKGKITDYYPPQARERLMATLKARGEVRGFTQEATRPDGSKMHLLFNAALDKTRQYIDLYVMDVTRLKEAEARLKEAELRYRTVFDNSPFAIIRTHTPTGRIVLANDYAAEELGFDSVEHLMEEADIRDMYSPERRKELFARLKRDGFVRNFEVDLTRKDGKVVRAMINARPDPTGEYLDSFGFNITDIKATEERLRDWEEMASSFLDSQLVGFMRSSLKDGTILQANLTTARGMGFDSVEEMKEKVKATDLYPTEARKEILRRLEKDGTLSDFEVELTRPDGGKVHILLNARVDREHGYLDSIGIDVTEWRKADIQLKETEESYKAIFEDSPIGIIRNRLRDGKIVMANRRAAEQYGFDNAVDFMENCRTTDFYPAETRDRLLDLLRRYGHFTNIEVEATIRDGSKRRIIVSARVDPTGQYSDATGMDITEMREAEERLRKASEVYGHMFCYSTVGQARIRLEDSKVLLANDALARMLGYGSAEELTGGFSVEGNVMDVEAWTALTEEPGGSSNAPGKDARGPARPDVLIPSRRLRMKRQDGGPIELIVSGRVDRDEGYMDVNFTDTSMFDT